MSAANIVAAPAAPHQIPTDRLPEDNSLEAGDHDSYASSNDASDTTSVKSSIYRGYIENGRRYQSTNDGGYLIAADDKQWEVESLTHLIYLILDSQQKNVLFRAPLGHELRNVLDVGCGSAEWAIQMADHYPDVNVNGVDLTPPPQSCVPMNCVLEVDDCSREWQWNKKFDLVHMRYLAGSFTPEGFNNLYKQAYDNLLPGGWIEHTDTEIGMHCDDGSLPADSMVATHGDRFLKCGERAGMPLNTIDHMETRIKAAGFQNVHVQDYKIPIGSWPKHPILKDCGRVKVKEVLAGIEGWCIYLLTKFGPDKPWSFEESQAYLDEFKREILNPKYHTYVKARRVWAQRPVEKKVDLMDIVNLGFEPREHHNHYQHHHHHHHHGKEDARK